jgi:hypothetical protein
MVITTSIVTLWLVAAGVFFLGFIVASAMHSHRREEECAGAKASTRAWYDAWRRAIKDVAHWKRVANRYETLAHLYHAKINQAQTKELEAMLAYCPGEVAPVLVLSENGCAACERPEDQDCVACAEERAKVLEGVPL